MPTVDGSSFLRVIFPAPEVLPLLPFEAACLFFAAEAQSKEIKPQTNTIPAGDAPGWEDRMEARARVREEGAVSKAASGRLIVPGQWCTKAALLSACTLLFV